MKLSLYMRRRPRTTAGFVPRFQRGDVFYQTVEIFRGVDSLKRRHSFFQSV